MSYYDSRHRAKRDRYPDEPYVDGQLVRRQSDDSVEEVSRDFLPGDYYYEYGPQRSRGSAVREGIRRARSVNGPNPYYDDEDDEYYRRENYRPRRSRRYDDRRE